MANRRNFRDHFVRGSFYNVRLPDQQVVDLTDGRTQKGLGVEQAGDHPCLVWSNAGFNDVQSRGLVVIPMTSAIEDGGAKFRIEGPWVRVRSEGELRYVLCEQIRYVDRSRCGDYRGMLAEHDLKQVEAKLKALFAPDVSAAGATA
jgi:mRNA-degrading endonuclease toxin of MazEF toxin-antitoxin module